MRIDRLFAEHPDLVDNRMRATGCIYKFARDIRWLVVDDEPDDLDVKLCHLRHHAPILRPYGLANGVFGKVGFEVQNAPVRALLRKAHLPTTALSIRDALHWNSRKNCR